MGEIRRGREGGQGHTIGYNYLPYTSSHSTGCKPSSKQTRLTLFAVMYWPLV